MPTPPPPGTVGVGELLVDAQSRALWLGVAPTLDPAQALLVSDIQGLVAEIADVRADLTQALTTGLATKANVTHTHVIQDTIGLENALSNANASVPALCVIMFAGLAAQIPLGFILCDGRPYASGKFTPNLADRFVIAAGRGYAIGAVGGGISGGDIPTTTNGAHAHTGQTNSHVLIWQEMPYHNHSVTDAGSHTHGLDVRFYDPGHSHSYADFGAYSGEGFGVTSGYQMVDTARNTNHVTTGGYINYAAADYRTVYMNCSYNGGNWGHFHVISQDAGHSHTVNVPNSLPPYYALAYIMKIPEAGQLMMLGVGYDDTQPTTSH